MRRKLPFYIRLVTASQEGGTGGQVTEEPPAGKEDDGKQEVPKKEDGTEWTPAELLEEVKKLRVENARDRTNGKTKAAEEAKQALLADITKALGISSEKPTVEQVAAQLTEATSKSTEAEARAAAAERSLAVHNAAGKHNADPTVLTDSSSFMASIADIDPSDTKAIEDAVKKAITDNPRFKASPTGTGYRVEKAGPIPDAKPLTMAEAIAAKYRKD